MISRINKVIKNLRHVCTRIDTVIKQFCIPKIIDISRVKALKSILVDIVVDLIKVSLSQDSIPINTNIFSPLQIEVEQIQACIYLSISGHVIQHLDIL
jgi:hypothetical protein